jgi:Flp pilus assembly protein TadG
MYRRHLLSQSQQGIAAIEVALLLPLLMAILLGVLEFGIYFTKSSVVSRAVSSTSNSIQLMPNATSLQTDARSSGFGLVNFTSGQNYFCALSYSTRALAEAGMCSNNNQWMTSTPAGHPAGQSYYVAIVASVRNTPLSGMTNFLPDIVVRNIVQVGGSSNNSRKGFVKLGFSRSSGYYNYAAGGTVPPMSGSWVVPEGVTDVKVTLVSGGACGSSGLPGPYWSAVGGPSGNVLVATITNLNPGTSIAYTVSGSSPGGMSTGSSMSGGSTTFNGLAAVGGWSFSASGVTHGTLVNVEKFPSNPGDQPMFSYNGDKVIWLGGAGGDTPLGFGQGGTAAYRYNDPHEIHGRGYGSGGAGETYYSSIRTTGNGAPGVIIIEW